MAGQTPTERQEWGDDCFSMSAVAVNEIAMWGTQNPATLILGIAQRDMWLEEVSVQNPVAHGGGTVTAALWQLTTPTLAGAASGVKLHDGTFDMEAAAAGVTPVVKKGSPTSNFVPRGTLVVFQLSAGTAGNLDNVVVTARFTTRRQ